MPTEEIRNNDLESFVDNTSSSYRSLRSHLFRTGVHVCITTIVISFLYPLRTIKTRIQSEKKYTKTGLYRNLYRGLLLSLSSNFLLILLAVSVEFSPRIINTNIPIFFLQFIISLVLVPRDNIVQLKQTSPKPLGTVEIFLRIYRENGITNGLYRGYWSTLLEQVVLCVLSAIFHKLFNDVYKYD